MTETEPCWAGRKAFNNGNPTWRMPCMRSMEPTHVITDPTVKNAPVILLCDFHYQDVLAQGLITMPDLSPEQLAEGRRLRPEIFGPS